MIVETLFIAVNSSLKWGLSAPSAPSDPVRAPSLACRFEFAQRKRNKAVTRLGNSRKKVGLRLKKWL